MMAFDVLEDLRHRTAEAIIAQSGLGHDGLRHHLRQLLSGTDVRSGALLQEPIIEGAHPFVTANKSLQQLSGELLHADFVNALDGLDDAHDYRFPRHRRPFQHQLEAWRLLSGHEPQSVVVTSGTGSGKTECFLFPILSDLAGQAAPRREPLEGVQAIMLYPLNALIESQQERLSAWTRPFRGLIRYGLYNGDLPRTESAANRRASPQQVIDREVLRQAPPPLLVTNVTMLEYMLVRAEDKPIIDASQGKLKWIVLDEAHSLVGAAAAEIALLLRRTMLAFGVRPEEVRFVATSATIGQGEETRAQLQRFLADVAGVPESSVHVVEGRRKMPSKPEANSLRLSPTDLFSEPPNRLYEALGGDERIWKLVERLFSGSVPLSEFAPTAQSFGCSPSELVAAMAKAARTSPTGDEERLAPIRIHAFERAVPGLWSCVNPSCSKRPDGWPYGGILPDRADYCPHCFAPVLEIVGCTECGEVYLEGIETGAQLAAPVRNPPRDEFAFDSARDTEFGSDLANEADDENGDGTPDEAQPHIGVSLQHLFASRPTDQARPFWLEIAEGGWRVIDGPSENCVALRSERHGGNSACPHCSPTGGNKELLRPVRFGAPFILGNAAPVLLEAVTPATAPSTEKLPFGGRRLLSFTDSRQGTARMAAKLQVESERNFVRSFIYHQVQASMAAARADDPTLAELRDKVEGLQAAHAVTPVPAIAKLLEEHRRELSKLAGGSSEGIDWTTLVNRLAERPEVANWILPVWQARDEELFSTPVQLAQLLIMREFDRRPKQATSMESLGFAKLRNPAVSRLTETNLPGPFKARGKSLDDWKAYLDTVLTHFVRNNRFSSIDNQHLHWISHRAVRRSLVGPDRSTDNNSMIRGWPNGYFRAHPRSRPVALLLKGLGMTLDDDRDRADLDECLRLAWDQLQATFSPDPERRIYDFSKAFVAPVVDAFWCPVTRRILDCAPFGLTPYGLNEGTEERRRAVPISMPRHPAPLLGDMDPQQARTRTREWIATDAAIADLRHKGAWTNISDRIALFSDYARSAEHSAQQDSRRLRRYESEFKAGRINILNCSTTMEMGVDIGSVSSVMMTNVPPSIANYRQRVGRAGRRGQALSLAFTFCKDRPLDREAFEDPQAFLQRGLMAPKVTLSSRPIVQRHVNAYLLGSFMRERAGDPLKMQVGAFFGCPEDPKLARHPRDQRPVAEFMDWLGMPTTLSVHREPVATLSRRSVLANDQGLIEATAEAVRGLEARFVNEWEGLVTLAKDDDLRDAGRSRMALELKRLCGEFLLGGLADRGFLPGHGFPTDVVSFIPGKEFKLPAEKPEDGQRQFRTAGPQRSLDIAIRDYAPGSEIVLDGLVHRSAGVTLNWKRPATEENLSEIQSLRHHWRCMDCGESDVSRPPETCPGCGSAHFETVEFLRPAGFSVDPRVRAHAETDSLSYVPPEEPSVSARGAQWKSLPVPELGRYRSSREGLVFYCNNGGPGKDGFEICLECGRAEAQVETASRSALADHKPLRFRKGQDRCPGNDKPFAVQRLSLGMEITTDVFELQLPRRLPRAAAHALAIALREALAVELGIESDEIGFAVGQSRTPMGAQAVSLFLFDRATGGAGFSVSLEHMLRTVFERTEKILDCNTPGCIRGCAACVLTADAPSGKDDLDRTAALYFMRGHLRLPARLETNDQFVEQADLSLAVSDEVHRELNRAPNMAVTIFLPEAQHVQALAEWPLSMQFRSWCKSGHRVGLAVPEPYLGALTAAEKLALRDFALRHDLVLMSGAPPAFPNGSTAIATVGNDSIAKHAWTSREAEPSFAGPEWGSPRTTPIARGDVHLSLQLKTVPLDELAPKPGASYRQLTRELDVDLASFGSKAAAIIWQLAADCGVSLSGRSMKVRYQDPYVSSPLVARLLIDTVWQLAKQSGNSKPAVHVETRSPRVDLQRGLPRQATHDWRDSGDQKTAIELLGRQRGLDVSVHHADVPHGRFLFIELVDGPRLTVVLDQGFGAWAPARSMFLKHDFTASVPEQVRRLATLNVVLERRGTGATYMVAKVEPRA